MKIFNTKNKNNKKYYCFCNLPIIKKVQKEKYCKYYFLGIRICKLKKSELIRQIEEIKQQLSSTKLLLTYFNDIEKLPPAKGVLRIIQLTMLKLLHEIDTLCQSNNIPYFMLYGTLLGAVRHKGFIPWDDDLDIVMLREDQERFLELIKEKYSNGNISYYYWSNTHYIVLKIILKIPNTPLHLCPFVDVHAFDTFYGTVDNTKYQELQNAINTLHRSVELIPITDIENQQKDILRNLQKIKEYTKNSILKNNIASDNAPKSIFMGAESQLMNLTCLQYQDVFPLIRIPFENAEYYAPKNYEKFLYQNYGDYMRPYIDGDMYHFDAHKYTYEQIKFMKDFIS